MPLVVELHGHLNHAWIECRRDRAEVGGKGVVGAAVFLRASLAQCGETYLDRQVTRSRKARRLRPNAASPTPRRANVPGSGAATAATGSY